MKVILVDKLYYPYSGVQDYFIDLVTLLRDHGHQVVVFDGFNTIRDFLDDTYINNSVLKRTFFQALNSLYSFRANYFFGRLLDGEKPDIVHINTIHHIVSPSIILEAKKRHIPVVYHLHDYKLVCPVYRIYKNETICTFCRNRNYKALLLQKCSLHQNYSLMESLFLYIESILHHNILNIYKKVDIFIAPSMFVKTMYEYMGFHGHIAHIPHFVFSRSKFSSYKGKKRKVIVYFGRVVKEKGLMTLLHIAPEIDADIRIIGSGEALPIFRQYCTDHNITNVSYTGFLSKAHVFRALRDADISILPSLWPEPFGKSIIESFSAGLPVIASDIGGIPEIIKHNKNGFLFKSGDERALKKTIHHFFSLPDKKINVLRQEAFATWEKCFSPELYYQRIMKVYHSIYARRLKKPEK